MNTKNPTLAGAKEKLLALENVLWRDFVSVRNRPTLTQMRALWESVAVIRRDLSTFR